MTSAIRKRSTPYIDEAINTNDFPAYQAGLVHNWLRTVTALVFSLVPVFFVLDTFILPTALLFQFGIYRAISTLLALGQHIIIRKTRPSRLAYIHGYFASMQVGAVISLMTVYLGGFNSGYYVGLILVMIGVSLVLPWKGKHTAINAIIIIGMYVGFNLIWPHAFETQILVNNLFFLIGAAIIAFAITELRHRLIENEFSLFVQLKQARDSLWSEMELAKDIQLSLLPKHLDISGFEIAATMVPAREVGGDYYEVVETDCGNRYVAIGDVAGHGLSAGLIMMMAQTSIMSVIKGNPDCSPSDALGTANRVLRENVERLGSHHYMTMSVLKLSDTAIEVAGCHQDMLIYRAASASMEVQRTQGTWLGIVDDIKGFVGSTRVRIGPGDAVLLFTDGLTEARSASGDMFGQERLERVFQEHARLQPADAIAAIMADVNDFQDTQDDDMTLLIIKKSPAPVSQGTGDRNEQSRETTLDHPIEPGPTTA